MSKLLINEYPLQVLPTLAKAIGLNEAMVLQQIHYWISNPKVGKIHADRRWIYNSVREWQEEQFPFWSTATIARALKSLRDKGLVEALDLNDAGYDKTLWYTINYEALNRLQESIIANCHNGLSQNDTIDSSNLIEPIPESTSENTKENNIYTHTGIATDDQIMPIINALKLVSKERYTNGRHQKFDDVALTIYQDGATPEQVEAFGEWWKMVCWYDPPTKAALLTIADEWSKFTEYHKRQKQAKSEWIPITKPDGEIIYQQVT